MSVRSLWILPLALGVPAAAATWCVNPAGTGGCMKTIGAAVTAAAAGDSVEVAAGTYNETVTIGKSLNLFGASPASTIIDATGLGNGINVDGLDNPNLSAVTISGFTVQNANFEGIVVTNASGVTIMGNTVTGNDKGLAVTAAATTCPNIAVWETSEGDDCGEGIHLSGVTNSTVLNNMVNANAGGILLSDDTGATTQNLVTNNVVTNNALDCGITLASHVPAASTGASSAFGVYGNAVTGNQSTQNGLLGEGAGVGVFASAPGTKAYANLVANNTITGNGIPGVSIHGHTPGQMLNGNIILSNTISGNGADVADSATPGTAGINIYSVSPVSGTIVAGNTISNETIAVAWNAPGEVRVQGNVLTSRIGVYNLGSGTVTADNDWWGCTVNPVAPISAIIGCATPIGAVTVNNWMTQPPASH
ncbi:MAG TPA: right-handed parallel beta-helix repeat-containing protein [Bryobacteraceae bacterium]|nr:right-handed parallel beta-helix repeat-containing protein [Bryobacteraceae bacterium]